MEIVTAKDDDSDNGSGSSGISGPTLELRDTYSFYEILRWAQSEQKKGHPLPTDLEGFLERHREALTLSKPELTHDLPFDPVRQYAKKREGSLHFIARMKQINPIYLYWTLAQELSGSHAGKEIPLSLEQVEQLKYSINTLYYFHGNVDVTGAPLILGGVTPVLFFQWGNFLGIIKYVVTPGEKALIGNLLLYVEEIEELQVEESLVKYLENQLGHTISPAELLRQCDRLQPQQFPQLLAQFTNTAHMQLLQTPSVLPVPRLFPTPFGGSNRGEE